MPFANSEWKNLDRNEYVRPLDGMEKFWYDLAIKRGPNGQRQFDVVLTVQIILELSSVDMTENAKQAWMKLRTIHPGIAAVTTGDKWIYKAADDDEKARWHQQAFLSVDTPHSSQQYIGTLQCTEYPTMHYLERTKEFILHAAHYYMDGHGACILMHDFLSELSQPRSVSPGDEVDHLSMSTSAAIGIPSPSEDLLETIFSESVKPKKLISLCHAREPSTSGNSALFKAPFSLAETEKIAKVAKVSGVSVTHFVHAALVMAAKHQGNYARGRHYSTLVSANLRDLCQNPSIATTGAASLRMAWWPMSVKVDDFWTMIYRVREGYDKIKTRKKSFLPALAPCLDKLSPEFDTRFFNSIILSSMGDISSYVEQPFNGFKVANMWGTVVVKNQVVFTHVLTLFGEMEITTAYNEAFHHHNQLKSMLGLAKEIMIHASKVHPRL